MEKISEYVGTMNKIDGVNLLSTEGNWVHLTVVFDDNAYKVCAKVFCEPSDYGINNGRISKLDIISHGGKIFNYDRGLDFNNAPKEVLEAVLKSFT